MKRHSFLGLLCLVLCIGVLKAQNVVVTGAIAGNGSYATLTDAFTAINGGAQTNANILISIVGNTVETASATLNQNSWNSLLIHPVGTRTIQGTLAGPLVDINGADRIVIDGLNTGGNSLVIDNMSTGTASTLHFRTDAKVDTVRNCTLLGANTSNTRATLYMANGSSTGNDSLYFHSCQIDASTAGFPIIGVYSSSFTGTGNDYISLINCNVANFFHSTLTSYGIRTVSSSHLTVEGCRLYQSATRTYGFTIARQVYGILIGATGENHTVKNNVIGYANAAGTGTYTMTNGILEFIALSVSGGTTGMSHVDGNLITNISVTTTSQTSFGNGAFCGIQATGNVDVGGGGPNVIGSTTGTNGVTLVSTRAAAIGVQCTGTGQIIVQNNTIAGMSSTSGSGFEGYLYGIYSDAGNMTATGNTIGNGVAHNLQAGAPGVTGSTLAAGIFISTAPSVGATVSQNLIQNLTGYGSGSTGHTHGIYIHYNTGTAPLNISGNTIRNITGTNSRVPSTNVGTSTGGIWVSGTSNNSVIHGNTIYNITNLHTGTGFYVVAGIATRLMNNPTISGNLIYGLSNAGTGTTPTAPPTCAGIQIRSGNGVHKVYNNMIALGNGQTNNLCLVGIWACHAQTPAPTDQIYHNTVHIEGTVGTGDLATFAYARGDLSTTSRAATMDIRNNIFSNYRTGGTGSHFAMGENYNSTPNSFGWPANASDRNVLNAASATVGYWSGPQTFGGWQAASVSDANSFSGLPLTFLNSANDLHLNMGATPTLIESSGQSAPFVTVDIDGQTRPGPAGSVNGGGILSDLGADEFDGAPIDQLPPLITPTTFISTCGTGDTAVAATINDVAGVHTSGPLMPRIYYRKNGGPWVSSPGALVSGTSQAGTWSFPILAASMGGVTNDDWIEYYLIAQDTVPNIGSMPAGGLVASDVNTVTTPPGTLYSYQAGGMTGTYTIGVGGDYTTLTAAVATFNSRCIAGPVVFSLADTSYPSETYPITILDNPYASAAKTLTIRPAAGVSPHLSGSNGAALLILDGADYVIVDGSNAPTPNAVCPAATASRDLRLTNTSTANGTAVIWLRSGGTGAGASHNIIRNCILRNGVNQSMSTTHNFAIVSCGSSINGTIPPSDGLENDSNLIENNAILRACWGIYLRGGFTHNSGNIVRQNVVGANAFGAEQVRQGGIILQQQAAAEVVANEVRFVGLINGHAATGTDHVGIGIGAVDGPTPTPTFVTNTTIAKNIVHDIVSEKDQSALGILVAVPNTGPSNNLLANNFIYNVRSNGTSGNQGIGINLSSGNRDQVVHNTIHMVTPDRDPMGINAASESDIGIRVQAAMQHLVLANNILYMDASNAATTVKNFALVVPSAAYQWGTGFCNHNAYAVNAAGTNNVLFGLGTTGTITPVATLPNWRAVFTPAQDLNSVNAVPVLVSPSNPHLVTTANPGLVGWGMPIAGVTDDIDCDPRSATMPNIGADDFPSCAGSIAGTLSPGDTSSCTPDSLTIFSTGFSTGTGVSYTWEVAPLGTGAFSGTSGTNPAGFSTGLVTVPYEYRLKVSCAMSGIVGYSDTISFLVGDTTAPVAGCQSITVVLDSTGTGTATAAALNNNSSDNCTAPGSLVIGASPVHFDCGDVGTVPVVLTVDDGNGNRDTCHALATVNPSPLGMNIQAPLTPGGFHVRCFGGSDGFAFAATNGGCAPYTYQWSNGQTAAVANGLGPGLYTVTVTDATGQTSIQSIGITEPPTALNGTATSTAVSCVPGADGTIDLTPTGGSPGYGYAWSGGQTTQDLSGLGAGFYSVVVTDTAGCTLVLGVAVNAATAPPTPVITLVGNTLSTATLGVTYQWYLNGSPVSGASASTFTPTIDGNYTVMVTDTAGCWAISAPFVFVGVPEGQRAGLLEVWPNPTQGNLTVRWTEDGWEPWTLYIYDLNGKVAYRRDGNSSGGGNTAVQLDLDGLPAGMYLLELRQGEHRMLRRLTVE